MIGAGSDCPLRWRHLNWEVSSVPHPVSLQSQGCPALGSSLLSFPALVFFQPRAEAAGLEGTGLEGEAQQRTLPWNQVSTLPFLMDSKGKSGLEGGPRNSPVLAGQS